jgi:hypothetical protein
MKARRPLSICRYLLAVTIACIGALPAKAVDRVIIGNVSRTVEQLPNYAATDKGFFLKKESRVTSS